MASSASLCRKDSEAQRGYRTLQNPVLTRLGTQQGDEWRAGFHADQSHGYHCLEMKFIQIKERGKGRMLTCTQIGGWKEKRRRGLEEGRENTHISQTRNRAGGRTRKKRKCSGRQSPFPHLLLSGQTAAPITTDVFPYTKCLLARSPASEGQGQRDGWRRLQPV